MCRGLLVLTRAGSTQAIRVSYGSSAQSGLSPRARGRQRGRHPKIGVSGSIPASSGETKGVPLLVVEQLIDPRVRGGDNAASSAARIAGGQSPSARKRRGGLKSQAQHFGECLLGCLRGSEPSRQTPPHAPSLF